MPIHHMHPTLTSKKGMLEVITRDAGTYPCTAILTLSLIYDPKL